MWKGRQEMDETGVGLQTEQTCIWMRVLRVLVIMQVDGCGWISGRAATALQHEHFINNCHSREKKQRGKDRSHKTRQLTKESELSHQQSLVGGLQRVEWEWCCFWMSTNLFLTAWTHLGQPLFEKPLTLKHKTQILSWDKRKLNWGYVTMRHSV